jgi:hypothetical protein
MLIVTYYAQWVSAHFIHDANRVKVITGEVDVTVFNGERPCSACELFRVYRTLIVF